MASIHVMDRRLFWVTLNGGRTWRHVTEAEYLNLQQVAGLDIDRQRPTFRKGSLAGRVLRPEGLVFRWDEVLG